MQPIRSQPGQLRVSYTRLYPAEIVRVGTMCLFVNRLDVQRQQWAGVGGPGHENQDRMMSRSVRELRPALCYELV